MINILHIDDDVDHHELTKAQLLSIDSDLEFVRVASADDAMVQLPYVEADCLLGDDLDEEGGILAVLQHLREGNNLLPCLILTDDEEPLQDGIKVGLYAEDAFNVAISFCRFDLLYFWIRKLFMDSSVRSAAAGDSGGLLDISAFNASQLINKYNSLTPREKEILQTIAKGLSNKEIAGELGVSYRTAINHVHNLFVKLEIGSRAEAIQFAYSLHLLDSTNRPQ